METTAVKFSFGEPLWLFALAIVPVLALLFFLSQRRGEKLISRMVSRRLQALLAGTVSKGMRFLRAVLILTALALGVVCLAQPRSGFVEQEIKQKGRDVILAFDVSRSMLATDVPPTRLARAKLFARDLLALLGKDRVGVIAFAGSAFLQAPLTQDQTAVLATVDELDTDLIPRGGTNLAAAIDTAAKAFGNAEGVTKALVIVTDGEELDADGLAAARRAAEQQIRIFTVGVGSEEGSLIPIRGPNGRADFVRDSAGKPVMTRLDASRLREIAEITGGFYQPLAEDAATAVFEKGILPLEETERKSSASRVPIESFQIPLGVAIGLLVFWLLLGERKWPIVLGRKRAGTAPVKAAAVGLILFALGSTGWAQGPDKYHAGDFTGALQDYEQQLTKNPEADKLNFNAGASAYRVGDFDKAVNHFTKALLSEEKHLQSDANYNLGNALVRRGEKATDTGAKKKDWENAIEYYNQTVKLTPENVSAKENLEIVKKLLEDLKKDDKKQDDKKQDQQKQDQQKQDQQKQDQQKQDQQKQDQQKQDQQKQDQQKQDQQKQDQQKQDQQKQDQQKQDQQKQDQQKQDQQKQDQQKQDQQKQDQQKQDQQKQDQQKQDQQKQDQQKQDQQKQDQQKQDQQKQDQQKQDQQKQDQQKQDQQKQDQQKQDQQKQDQPSQPNKGDQPLPDLPEPGEKKKGELDAKDEPTPEPGEMQAGEATEQPDGKMSEAQARALLRSLQNEEDRVRLMERKAQQETTRDW